MLARSKFRAVRARRIGSMHCVCNFRCSYRVVVPMSSRSRSLIIHCKRGYLCMYMYIYTSFTSKMTQLKELSFSEKTRNIFQFNRNLLTNQIILAKNCTLRNIIKCFVCIFVLQFLKTSFDIKL